MQRQFPVFVGVFVIGSSALGCGVSDSEIPDRSWWTRDASVGLDAGDASANNPDAAAADGGENPYGNDGSVDSGSSSDGGNGGAAGQGGAAGGEPQAGGGGVAGDAEPEAGSGGEAAAGAGGIGAAGSDAGGTGGSGGSAGPTCPTQYVMATHVVMNVTWPASKVSGITVVNAGSGKVHVWTRSQFNESGSTATVVSSSCGTALPPIKTTAIAGSEMLLPQIPDAVWEKPSMPKFNGTASKSGNVVTGNPGIALVGLKMTNPGGTWPSVTSVMGVDHDSDTHPGIAGNSKTDGGYKAIPVDISRSKRTDRLDLATRATMTLSATVDGCPETYSGTAMVTQFDNHIIGCHIEGGGECDTTQRDFVDSNRTIYKVSSATFTTTRVADDATCADVRAALP